MKTQILNSILDVVCDICEVKAEVVRSMTKTTDVVQARAIFVSLCSKGGVSRQDIASYLNRKNVDCIGCCMAAHEIYHKHSQFYRELHKHVTDKVTSTLSASRE